GARGMAEFRDGIGEALVSRFVHLNPVPSYCAQSGFANPEKVRWRRTFARREVDEICAPLGVGSVRSLSVEGRGVSGRARALGSDAGEDLLAPTGCWKRVLPEADSRASERRHWTFGKSPPGPTRDYNDRGMPLPQQPARRGRRLTLAVAISVAVHFILLLGVAKDAMFQGPKHPPQQVVSLVTSNRSQLQGLTRGPSTNSAG